MYHIMIVSLLYQLNVFKTEISTHVGQIYNKTLNYQCQFKAGMLGASVVSEVVTEKRRNGKRPTCVWINNVLQFHL